jgi:hypothetical protein
MPSPQRHRDDDQPRHGKRTFSTRLIERRNLFQAELAIREMGTLSLLDALAYLELLADVRPEKLERAAVRSSASLMLLGGAPAPGRNRFETVDLVLV